MKNLRFWLLSFCTFLIFTTTAQANKFKGYSRNPSSESLVLKDVIDRVQETDSDFLILIMHHPAFYRFPKNPETAKQIRDFLRDRLKKKKVLEFQIDPVSAEIYYLNDADKN